MKDSGPLSHEQARVAEASTGAPVIVAQRFIPRGLGEASLPGMVMLKLVAWRACTDEDVADLARLLEVSSRGRFGDERWDDQQALEHCHYDPVTAAAYRLGLAVARTADPEVVDQLVELVTVDRDLLVARTSRDLAAAEERWDALADGLSSQPRP